MDKKSSPLDKTADLTTLAGYGLRHLVNDKTIFCTPDPMAASTSVRNPNRMQRPSTGASSMGSFLNDMSRLSMQSVSSMDLSNHLRQLNFTQGGDVSRQDQSPSADAVQESSPDLIQFSANTEAGGSDKSDTSSRSSMGLIPSEMLEDNDLLNTLSGTGLSSASLLPLSTPQKVERRPDPRTLPPEQDNSNSHQTSEHSHSTLKEKTADSKDWSDSSQSKQDSKDMPSWGRSQLETVKKRPEDPESRKEGAGGGRGLLAPRGALFAAHSLDDVAEGEEFDQSVHQVELGEDDLRQLDAGMDFSDLEEDQLSGRESGDEDFDFDEPLLSLPTRGRVSEREEEEGERTLQAELAEAEGRLGEGQESEDEGAGARIQQPAASDDAGLDSRYFRQTPTFAGDGEDSEVSSSRHGNLSTSSHHRGAAEGEHSLTKLRRQFMTGDGSDDDVKASKQSSLSTRERGQGADEADTDRSNLPLPVGLEDVAGGYSGNKGSEAMASQFSFLTRQRAEGDADHSPVPWGGGDGSSGEDSDIGAGQGSSGRPPVRYVSGAAVASDQSRASRIPSDSQTGDDTEPGLKPEYFLRTAVPSVSQFHDSDLVSPGCLEGSSFCVEDVWKSAAGDLAASTQSMTPGETPRAEATGFGDQGGSENPFEAQFSSFGSFGLGPEEEEPVVSDRSWDKATSQGRCSREEDPSPRADPAAKPAVDSVVVNPKDNGSFDGPFRKPRAPAPARKKIDKDNTYEVDNSDSWRNATFQETEALEQELQNLGISVGDDDFQSSEGALAMLDADEKQFEAENKFSEHHLLALAAEGLDWEDEEFRMSGYLGGEGEHPELGETSIGTYMAARTETLGTLGGDPTIPRPEFGLPVNSPPHRTFPFRLVSPPSTTSSAHTSRTEGEGDDEADKTMVSGDQTLLESALSPSSPSHSPSRSPACLPAQREEEESKKSAAAAFRDERKAPPSAAVSQNEPPSASAAAEVSLREELTSMLHDLTHDGGGDLTMEDALSSSAVLNFFKNHSYSDTADFVSGIMKLSTAMKHSGKGAAQKPLDSSSGGKKSERHAVQKAVDSSGRQSEKLANRKPVDRTSSRQSEECSVQKPSVSAVESRTQNEKQQTTPEKSVRGINSSSSSSDSSFRRGTQTQVARNEKEVIPANYKSDSDNSMFAAVGKQTHKQEAGLRKEKDDGDSTLSFSSSGDSPSSVFTSTVGPRSSRLPVRMGSTSSPPTENRPAKTKSREDSKVSQQQPETVSARWSQSGQRGGSSGSSASEDYHSCVSRQSVTDSRRDGSSSRSIDNTSRRDIKRSSVTDTSRRDNSRQRGDKNQQQSSTVSHIDRHSASGHVDTAKKGDVSRVDQSRGVGSDVPLSSVSGPDIQRSRQEQPSSSSCEAASPRLQGPVLPDPSTKNKKPAQVGFHQDQMGGMGDGMILSSTEDLTTKFQTSPERESKWEQQRQDPSYSSGALPLNIKPSLEKAQIKGSEHQLNYNNNNASITTPAVAFEKSVRWKDTESFRQQKSVLQTPPQRVEPTSKSQAFESVSSQHHLMRQKESSSSQPPVSESASSQQQLLRQGGLGSVSEPYTTLPSDPSLVSGPSSLPAQAVTSVFEAQPRPVSASLPQPQSLGVMTHPTGPNNNNLAAASSSSSSSNVAAQNKHGGDFPNSSFPAPSSSSSSFSPPFSSSSFPPPSSSSGDAHNRQPTLLTGKSLLQTEFAQKFLAPGMADARRQQQGFLPKTSGNQYPASTSQYQTPNTQGLGHSGQYQTVSRQNQGSKDQYISSGQYPVSSGHYPVSSGQYPGSAIHMQPDHLPPDNNNGGGGGTAGFASICQPTPSSYLPTPSIYMASSSSQATHGYSGGGGRTRPLTNNRVAPQGMLPNESRMGVDESAMSVYYELNEDLEQTTMLQGVDGSTLASFWGKSPLYQSTPALEVGKVAALSMVSALEERTLTSQGMATPRVQRQLIKIQRAMDFEEFCCLGVSQKTSLPVTNTSAFTATCRFRLVRLLHNGNPIKMDTHSPFELKPKVSVGAGATESVPVLFVPKRPGEHVCQIEVHTQSLNPTLEPTVSVVQLRAFAEVPQLQICPSVEVLDMGEVMWGGCVSRTIKLRNVRRASLPVRLSIWSGTSVWHCFTFDNNSCGGGGTVDSSSDMSIISMSSRPESLGRSVVTVMLPGCQEPSLAKTVEFTLHCRAPKKDLTRKLADRPAEQIDAKIDIEVDTPVKCLPPLSTMLLKATVGMPRLLISTSHMSMSFRTEPQRSVQESVTVGNAGNITLQLSLSVSTFPECFILSHTHLSVKPGGQEQVQVEFSPQSQDLYHFQSLLHLDVDPEGPGYEIPLEGRVVEGASRGGAINILTSQSFLAFHGVSLNQTRSLTLKLYNKDHTNAEHACVEVRQSTNCFKLVSASGEWQQKCDVVIEPSGTITLTVIFCPTAVTGYSGKLIIRRPNAHPSKYSIRLVGYGGRSVLTMSGACLTNSGQRWLELGSLAVGQNIMKEIVLTNTGVRAAFVRGSAFYDMPCRQPVSPGRVAVEPNNFVLAPGCSMKVMVAISPSEREVDLVSSRKEVVSVVRFQHGDEVMRQKFQRACNGSSKCNIKPWQVVFRQPFANEAQDSVVLEGSSLADSPNDIQGFLSHMESVCVALLAQPAPGQSVSSSPVLSASSILPPLPAHTPSSTRTPPPHRDSTLPASSLRPTHDRTYPRVREDSQRLDPTGQFLVPSRPTVGEDDWAVKPDFLSLTVGEDNQKILQLINFSKQTLSFELSWPPSSVVPEPKKGEIKPRSKLSIEVWLHMSWQQRLTELPWRGAVFISCNGQEKSVRVTVLKPAESPYRPLSSPSSVGHRSSPHATEKTLDTTAPISHVLKLAATNIHFTKAKVKGSQESVLEVTNASLDPLHLKLTPFAPAYVKGSDDSNTVSRAGFSVFIFPTTTTDLLPHETCKLPVKFCPQTKGTFNQHWEIEYWPLTGSKREPQDKKTMRISLTAEVAAETKKLTWEAVEQDKSSAIPRTPLQEKHPNTPATGEDKGVASSSSASELQLLQEEVVFPGTRCGQLAQHKVELKNSMDSNVELQVDPPAPPFRIKHTAFKITKKRILKYPIEFSPTSPGTFTDSLVFRAPALSKTFTVTLKGTSTKK